MLQALTLPLRDALMQVQILQMPKFILQGLIRHSAQAPSLVQQQLLLTVLIRLAARLPYRKEQIIFGLPMTYQQQLFWEIPYRVAAPRLQVRELWEPRFR